VSRRFTPVTDGVHLGKTSRVLRVSEPPRCPRSTAAAEARLERERVSRLVQEELRRAPERRRAAEDLRGRVSGTGTHADDLAFLSEVRAAPLEQLRHLEAALASGGPEWRQVAVRRAIRRAHGGR